MRERLTFFILLCLCGHTYIAAQTIVALDSGEQLIGDVLPQSNQQTIYIRSAILGDVQLPRARVLSIQPQAVEAPSVPVVKAKLSPAPRAVVDARAEAEESKIVDRLKDFKAPDDWSGNMRFGVNFSQGDRKWAETYARGVLEIDPKTSDNFYRFTGSYTYRQTERSDGSEFKSTDKYNVEFIYRRSFRDDWFVQNALGGRVDQIKGIEREVQESVGVGYKYKPSGKFEFLLGGGGGVEDYEADLEDSRAGLSPIFNIFQEATWRPLKRTSFVQKFNYYWNPEESEQFNYVFSAAVRVRLTDLLGLEFSYNKSFDNDVGNGNARDDTQWRNALVVYF